MEKPRDGAELLLQRKIWCLKAWFWPTLTLISVWVILSARFLRILSRYSVNIFFGDAWGFDYGILSPPQSLWSIFRLQYGPHRQGLGAIYSFLLGNWSHWNSPTESMGAGLVVVLAAGLAVYLKVRLYGPITYLDTTIPLVILTPSQFESFASYINPAHGPFPVLLVILYCLSWTIKSLPSRYVFVLLTGFVTTYTGFGLFIGLITPVLLAIECYGDSRSSWSFTALLVSITSLGSFFIGYQVAPAIACYGTERADAVSVSLTHSIGYLRFASLMFANLFQIKGASLLPMLCGSIILAVLTISLAMALRSISVKGAFWLQRLIPATLLAYSLLFVAFTAIGRLCAGLVGAQQARYMPYLALGVLGLYFFFLSIRQNVGIVILFTAAILSSLFINSADRGRMTWVAAGKREWKNCYLNIRSVEKCNAYTQFRIDSGPDPANLKSKLEFLERNRFNLFAESHP